jgi:hypothetical protein
MNIEQILYPKANKLSKKGYIQLIDAELDSLDCYVVKDCIEINTKEYTYITLTKIKLYKMIQAIDKMNKN